MSDWKTFARAPLFFRRPDSPHSSHRGVELRARAEHNDREGQPLSSVQNRPMWLTAP